MRYLLSFLLALALAFSAWGADNDIAVMPGGQYVLRNVATGSYLMKDGTTTRDWSPRADIVLYFHPNDDVVPHLNLVSFVSGNNFYPSKPQTLTAVFLPDIQTGVSAHRQNVDKDNLSDNQSFDLAGRRIITPRGGQIIIRNRQKVVVK